ncbi:MAG: tripartite tricarboxylate transporter substrate binding protein [Pseudomonadota bacterium]
MRRFIAGLAAVLLATTQAVAQTPAAISAFPTKPITIIVSVAPGGTLDALARIMATSLTTTLKQPVLVENVTGAGGLVGFQRLMKSPADGYTLMFSNMSMVLIPLLYPKAGINAVSDVAPIGTIATVPMVLGVSHKSGIPDLATMLARMRDGSLKPDLGSGGPGTTAHLAEGLFLQLAGGKGELIQYRGSGPALTDLMAGTIDAVIDQTVTMMPMHQDKRIKAIAVSSPQRVPQMPDVPTFAESGLPEFDLSIWNGFVAPKGTPKAVVDALAEALSKVIDSPDYKERLDQLASQAPAPAERGPAAFTQVLQRDQKRLAGMAQAAGLQAR